MHDRTFPNETTEYRHARNELLEAEQALREQTERVAALRRTLPVGGRVKEDYVFDELDPDGATRQVALTDLFAGKDSLFLYGFMFGPKADNPCPMCSSLLDALDGNAPHIRQRIGFAVSARAPIERIRAFADKRGWRNLRLVSSLNNSYQSDYFAEDPEGGQWPMANVFVKRDDGIYHYWASELLFVKYGGGDPRHMDAMWPLWNLFDATPEGRGEKWYPTLWPQNA